MKPVLLATIFSCFAIALFAQNQKVELRQLQQSNNVYFYEEKPYTGMVYEKYENGSIGLWGELKNGKREGVWTYWYRSGTKKRETTFVNNQKEGTTYYWHENGSLAKEITFRANQNIDQKLWDNSGTRLKNPRFEIFK
ncbi:MAG: hypothetical protein FWC39_05235 [Bacteroidetes bacterium]|nr:hypothetical protein [Bacteroidota bacterium]